MSGTKNHSYLILVAEKIHAKSRFSHRQKSLFCSVKSNLFIFKGKLNFYFSHFYFSHHSNENVSEYDKCLISLFSTWLFYSNLVSVKSQNKKLKWIRILDINIVFFNFLMTLIFINELIILLFKLGHV